MNDKIYLLVTAYILNLGRQVSPWTYTQIVETFREANRIWGRRLPIGDQIVSANIEFLPNIFERTESISDDILSDDHRLSINLYHRLKSQSQCAEPIVVGFIDTLPGNTNEPGEHVGGVTRGRVILVPNCSCSVLHPGNILAHELGQGYRSINFL